MQNVNDFFIVSDIQQIGLSQKDFKNQLQQKRISYIRTKSFEFYFKKILLTQNKMVEN